MAIFLSQTPNRLRDTSSDTYYLYQTLTHSTVTHRTHTDKRQTDTHTQDPHNAHTQTEKEREREIPLSCGEVERIAY